MIIKFSFDSPLRGYTVLSSCEREETAFAAYLRHVKMRLDPIFSCK